MKTTKQDRRAHEATMRRLIDERGLRLTPAGVGLHLTGRGIDVKFSDWRMLRASDLEPVRSPLRG